MRSAAKAILRNAAVGGGEKRNKQAPIPQLNKNLWDMIPLRVFFYQNRTLFFFIGETRMAGRPTVLQYIHTHTLFTSIKSVVNL
jgi:hypothetical protein